MSYVHLDDQHEDGQISEFRRRLSAEVRMQTGVDFPIFQDRDDIAWGQNWRSRIEEGLDTVTFLIPIVTPSFFRSPHCRDEVSRFVQRERELGRGDLILPVYYIGTPELDDPVRRDADEIATLLATRQHADWRELRFEPLTSPVVRRALAHLAHRLRDGFRHSPPPAGRTGPRGAATDPAVSPQGAGARTPPVAKSEPPTHVVDPHHRGDFPTIGQAITAARPGDRILVRPGLYEEGLVIDKPLELLGDGPPADIEVRARDADALLFKANIGRVANLTLRQVGGKGVWYGVDVVQGRLELEGCDISSQNGACVGIRNGADPRLHRNRIHDGRQGGVQVYDGGLGLLEDNDIHGNALAGVEITTRGNPTLRRNQIHHGKQGGVFVQDEGLGLLEDNDIHGNALAGVEITTRGNPTLRRNEIHDGTRGGVYVHDNGLGLLEDNDVHGNAMAGVEIKTGGDPTLRRNRITRNAQGIRVHAGGRGVIEANTLAGNAKAWAISASSRANVTLDRNVEE